MQHEIVSSYVPGDGVPARREPLGVSLQRETSGYTDQAEEGTDEFDGVGSSWFTLAPELDPEG
jgi:hypothetical protein